MCIEGKVEMFCKLLSFEFNRRDDFVASLTQCFLLSYRFSAGADLPGYPERQMEPCSSNSHCTSQVCINCVHAKVPVMFVL